ncbi:ABC transporter permease [Aeromicrobium sp. CTD01-1L150]|uniref:ABC transporter permease n=1 Tax=Aeromicrobium sp. CTD01-1L150 TaxID=3341830 RepID=UPI0035C0D481
MSTSTGAGALLRLAARRDRIKLPVWIGSIAGLAWYFTAALQIAYPSRSDLQTVVSFLDGPAGTIMSGPGYGMDDPSYPSTFAAVYGLYILLGAAFMNVLLVIRHTRAEEESGRTELVRAAVAGRHSALASVGILALVANLALGALTALALSTQFPAGGSWLFGASVAAVGLAFAGITAVAVQVTEHARTAAGLASALIGLAMILRGVGDVLQDQGSVVSWLSPFAWAQQTRVFVEPRAWPLLLCVGVAIAGVVAGTVLQSRRDVGAGLVAARRGPSEAGPRLSSAWALALRLERGAIVGWACALLVAGLLYGSLADAVQSSFDDLPDDIVAVMGGDAHQLLDGFMSVMVFFNVSLAGAYAIAAVHRLTSEELAGRTEAVLSTATGRATWMGAGLAAAAIGATAVVLASALGISAAAALTIGDAGTFTDLFTAHLAYLPALGVVIGLAALGFGIRPRLANAAWVVLVFAMFIGYLGPLFDPPRAILWLSPFEHVARLPLDDLALWPLVGLALVAAGLIGTGLAVFTRRDLTTSS